MKKLPKVDLLELGVHSLCILVITIVFILAVTLFKNEPAIGTILLSAGTYLYGKLTGKPAKPVLDKLITQMEPEHVVELMSKRPPRASKYPGPAPIKFEE